MTAAEAAGAVACCLLLGPAQAVRAQAHPLSLAEHDLSPGQFEIAFDASRVRHASFHSDAIGAGEISGDFDLDSRQVYLRAGLSRSFTLRLAGEWRRNTFRTDAIGAVSASGIGWSGVGIEWTPTPWQAPGRTVTLGLDALFEGRREGYFPVRSGRPGADFWYGATWTRPRSTLVARTGITYRQRVSDSTKSSGELGFLGGWSWSYHPAWRVGLVADGMLSTESRVAGAVMYDGSSYQVGLGVHADLVALLPHTTVSLFTRRSLIVHNGLQGTRVGVGLTFRVGS